MKNIRNLHIEILFADVNIISRGIYLAKDEKNIPERKGIMINIQKILQDQKRKG